MTRDRKMVRIIVGVALFVVAPAVFGMCVNGWVGAIAGAALVPCGIAVLAAICALVRLVYWILGTELP